MAKTEQPDKMVTKKQSDMNSEIPRKPNPLAAKCCFGIQISPPVVLLLYQVCYQSELLKSMTRDVQTKCLSFVPKSYVTLSVTDSDKVIYGMSCSVQLNRFGEQLSTTKF